LEADMKTNRYILVLEVKPENAGDFRKLHLNTMNSKHAGQPKAVLDSGISENIVYLYGNVCIVYIETEYELDAVLGKLGETDEYKLFAAEEAPWLLPSESLPKVEKIYDARQMLDGGFKAI
jgi:hypothetical protein